MKRLLLLSTFLLLVTPTYADTIFSTFGSSDSYDTINNGWRIGTLAGSGITQNVAASFTPAFDVWFDSADVALKYENGQNGWNVSLMNNDASGLPGTTIESFSITGVTAGIYTVNSILNPLLMAGTQYWLGVFFVGDLSGYWKWNSQGYTGWAAQVSGSSWSFSSGSAGDITPAFRVSGTPVPEPTSLLLLGTGLGFMGLAVYRRRRK